MISLDSARSSLPSLFGPRRRAPTGNRPGVPLSVGAGLPATRKTGNAALTLIAGKPAPTGHKSL